MDSYIPTHMHARIHIRIYMQTHKHETMHTHSGMREHTSTKRYECKGNRIPVSIYLHI